MTDRRLTIESPPGEPAVIFRRFVDAPPELVFEVDRPHRLVRTFVYAGAPEDESIETVTFLRDGHGTLVTSTSVFPSFAARDFYAQAGMEVGLRESHQRLDEWIETIHNQTRRRQ